MTMQCCNTFLSVFDLASKVLPSSHLPVGMTFMICCFNILYLPKEIIICTLNTFAKTLVREVVMSVLLLTAALERHVNWRWELGWTPHVPGKSLEKKILSNACSCVLQKGTLYLIKRRFFPLAVWLPCCAN